MSGRRAFLAWRWSVVFFANVPNLLMVLWLFFRVTSTNGAGDPGAARWNVGIFVAFASLHSVMACETWKRAFGALFPAAFERPIYVIVSGISLVALLTSWRPMPMLMWRIEGFAGRTLDVLFWAALAFAWWVGRSCDQPSFIGTRQLAAHYRREPLPKPEFVIAGAFRYTRHPMYLGMLVLLWSASTLTAGRLLFNLLASAYFLIGLRFEERRLARAAGSAYQRYRDHVPMLIPRGTPWVPPADDLPNRRDRPAGVADAPVGPDLGAEDQART